MGVTSASDHKIDAKIEGVDLNSLFDADGIPPSEVPSKLPNDLLPIVNDCGIILL